MKYKYYLQTMNKGWKDLFKHNIDFKNKVKSTLNIVLEEYDKEHILPEKENIFKCFNYFSPKDCKLVILGQDPYPGSEKIRIKDKNTKKFIIQENYYAEGLSFSVDPKVVKLPQSLKNIFKELKNNYDDFTFTNGSLEKWAKEEKILLLNTALTVQKGKANSHTKLWTSITDEIIKYLDNNSECIFLLMGGNAKKKEKIIKNKYRIITCVHPSPLSAYNGFFGSNVFKNINEMLKEQDIDEINWNL